MLLAFVLLISAVGVVEIYSATLHTKFVGAHIRQVYWIMAGLMLMLIISRISYQSLLEAGAVDVRDRDRVAGIGAAIRTEIPGSAALDQDWRGDALPAVGMGQAHIDPGDGQVFRRKPADGR